MSPLHVACTGWHGPLGRYWAQFGALELAPDAVERMNSKRLRRWRAEAPPTARFIVRTPPSLVDAAFAGEAAEAAWKATLSAIELLGSDTLLLATPARFRPTSTNRAALTRFFERPRPEGLRIAWWAEGLWEGQPEDRDAVCAAAGLIPAIDPLGLPDDEEPPEGPHFYWRLLGRRGMTGRFTDHELDTLLDLSADREGGHVVFTAATMLPDARRFAVLAGAAPSGSAETDED